MNALTINDLRAHLRDDAPRDKVATVLVTEDEASAAVRALQDDRHLAGVRVRLGGEALGWLWRTDAYRWSLAREKGVWDYQQGGLPGDPRPGAYRLSKLRCPVPDCADNPVVAIVLDRADLPFCRLHPESRLEEIAT